MNLRGREDSFFAVERPFEGRLLGGVCAGLAARYAVDVTLVRLAFLMLVLAKGIGLVVYGALWLLLPAPGMRSGERLGEVARENLLGLRREIGASAERMSSVWRDTDRSTWPRPLSRRWLGLGLIGAGVLVLMWSFGLFGWLSAPRVLGLVAVVGGAGVLISTARGGE